MMIGDGAEQFAREQNIELVDEKYFLTKARQDALQKLKDEEKAKAAETAKTPGVNRA